MSYFPFPSGVMDCVLQRDQNYGALFLSGVEAATNNILLQQNGIGAVLTIGTEMAQMKFNNHKIIQLHDMHSEPIKKYFEEAINFIEHQRKSHNVLVHCFVGVSRSATIVLAYLMQIYNYQFHQALNYLQSKRPHINPNPGFIAQLQIFENELLRKRIAPRPQSIDKVHRSQCQPASARAQSLQATPVKNATLRQSIQMTPTTLRKIASPHMTPSKRMSQTAETIKNAILQPSNQPHSAKKFDQMSMTVKAFCKTYASPIPVPLLLKKTTGSGLIRGRQPIKATKN